MKVILADEMPSRECRERQGATFSNEARSAFNDLYHKVAADVSFDHFERIFKFLKLRWPDTSAPTLGQAVEQTADRERWKRALSFAKGIISRLDTTEVMRSSVSGIAYDAAERAVFIRNLATEALAAPVVVQPQAAEPKGLTDERAEFLAYWCEDVPEYMREKWKENVDQCLQDGNATEKLSAAWDAWQARALLAKGE